MNVLVVSGHWTTEPAAGGVQSSVCTLVEALAKKHSVTVFVQRWQHKTLVREQHGKVTVYRRRCRYPHGGTAFALPAMLMWLVELPATLRDLRKIMREREIEVIHLHQLQWWQFNFAILRALGGPPYVATFHGRDVQDYPKRPWIQRKLINFIARRASAFTAVSAPLAELARATIPSVTQVQVIPNGVGDLVAAADDETERALGSLPSKYFISVGRLYPLDGVAVKGQDILIRAWQKLGERHPDIHLVIAGQDDGRSGYEKLAAECGVSDRVHILGPLPRSRLFAIMKRAMGMVSTSRSEGNPMAILEAGYFCLPVVASDIPPHAQALEDGVDSLLVPCEDPESTAAALARLASDTPLAEQLGQALQRKVETFSSGEVLASNYVDLAYRRAVKQARS